MERRFYVLRLLYDGGAFRGFAHQPGIPTVEGALHLALAQQGIRASLSVAARTDAGVHALGQVVSFASREELEPDTLRRALNRTLPDGIIVLDVFCVAKGFHARATARARRYVYLVGWPAPPVVGPYAWSLPDERAFPDLPPGTFVDPSRVRRALAYAVGTHDFLGFARPGGRGATEKTISRIDVAEASWAPMLALTFEGQGFLRAMIRNLVGTAVTAGVGLIEPDVVGSMLSARERYRGVRAPGWGLTLDSVMYPGGVLPVGRKI